MRENESRKRANARTITEKICREIGPFQAGTYLTNNFTNVTKSQPVVKSKNLKVFEIGQLMVMFTPGLQNGSIPHVNKS